MDDCNETILVSKMKKSSLHMKAVLNAKNPEIFTVSPRPGGYKKLKYDDFFSISPQNYLDSNQGFVTKGN